MAAGVRTAQEAAVKAQGELTLQIAELRLQAQQPLEYREQRRDEIHADLETMRCGFREYSRVLDQCIVMLTSLQEDPTIQRVESEVCELQQAYDTACEAA